MDKALTRLEPEVTSACRRHHVARLDVFGSAARTREGARDLDFVVEFEALPDGGHADAYFGLLEDLETMFDRPVDLVMASALTNPFVRASIERSRVRLYAA